MPSLRVPGKSCFKAPKVPLDECFYHWNVHFCYFCTKNRIWPFTVSESWLGTFSVFMSPFSLPWVLGEKILSDEIFGKMWNITFFEYFESLESFELNIELGAICRDFKMLAYELWVCKLQVYELRAEKFTSWELQA